jgi:hypothetical protein
MRSFPNRQEQTRARQLVLPFPDWGRRRADNDDDPFSWPHPPVTGELALLKVNMAPKLGRKIAPGSLTLADLAARCGPTEQIASNAGYKRR